MPWALGLFLAAAPVDARYLLTVGGVPLAELHTRLEGQRYLYESTHFLEEGPRVRRQELELDGEGRVAGLVPEVLALSRQSSASEPGCVTVLEEVRRAPERLCIDSVDGRLVRGRLGEVAFSARYDDQGRLRELTLPGSRWDATERPTRPPRSASPFADGFVVPVDGRPQLEPPVTGATWLARPPRGVGVKTSAGRQRCLVAARGYLAGHPTASLVLGLVVEGGRAWPHAWVVDGGEHLDPSVLPGDDLSRRHYVTLPAGLAGATYLDLLDGSRGFVSPRIDKR